MLPVFALESTGKHKLLIREYFRVFLFTLKLGLLFSGRSLVVTDRGVIFRVSVNWCYFGGSLLSRGHYFSNSTVLIKIEICVIVMALDQ